MNEIANVKAVALNERVTFHCRLCGGCCRNVEDSIMLEPMDAYCLARYLRDKRGEHIMGTEDVLARYAHPAWLMDNFPVFLLNTVGTMEVCTFLKSGRCSVYDARPRVCRLYPFSVDAGSKDTDFQYYLCTEKSHHFADGTVTAEDWLSQNFSWEAKTVLKADFDALPIIGQNVRAMDAEEFKRLAFQFIYYRYYNYALDKPFLPQFLSNLEKLKELTEGQRGG